MEIGTHFRRPWLIASAQQWRGSEEVAFDIEGAVEDAEYVDVAPIFHQISDPVMTIE